MHELKLLYLICRYCNCNLLTSESKVDSKRSVMDRNLPPVVLKNTLFKKYPRCKRFMLTQKEA